MPVVDVQLISLITQTGFAGLFVYLLIETRRSDAKIRDQQAADARAREEQLIADARAREERMIADAKSREAALLAQLEHCANRFEKLDTTMLRLAKWLERTE